MKISSLFGFFQTLKIKRLARKSKVVSALVKTLTESIMAGEAEEQAIITMVKDYFNKSPESQKLNRKTIEFIEYFIGDFVSNSMRENPSDILAKVLRATLKSAIDKTRPSSRENLSTTSWISVSERLPNVQGQGNYQYFLVHHLVPFFGLYVGELTIAYYDSPEDYIDADGEGWKEWSTEAKLLVTHWMHLPASPKT